MLVNVDGLDVIHDIMPGAGDLPREGYPIGIPAEVPQ